MPIENIPGIVQTAGLDALQNNFFNPNAINRLGAMLKDGGPSVKGEIGKGQYEFKFDPLGDDKSIQFNFRRPLQDFGIGNLFSQNMDPRQNFNVTV